MRIAKTGKGTLRRAAPLMSQSRSTRRRLYKSSVCIKRQLTYRNGDSELSERSRNHMTQKGGKNVVVGTRLHCIGARRDRRVAIESAVRTDGSEPEPPWCRSGPRGQGSGGRNRQKGERAVVELGADSTVSDTFSSVSSTVSDTFLSIAHLALRLREEGVRHRTSAWAKHT